MYICIRIYKLTFKQRHTYNIICFQDGCFKIPFTWPKTLEASLNCPPTKKNTIMELRMKEAFIVQQHPFDYCLRYFDILLVKFIQRCLRTICERNYVLLLLEATCKLNCIFNRILIKILPLSCHIQRNQRIS